MFVKLTRDRLILGRHYFADSVIDLPEARAKEEIKGKAAVQCEGPENLVTPKVEKKRSAAGPDLETR